MKQTIQNSCKEMPFVRKDNFRLLFQNIKDNSYNQNIKNWLKSGRLISLKRGLYIFSDYWERCQDKDRYLDFLSSIIYYPSYISKETILARYGMLTEAVYGISAVALKSGRTFLSDIALFGYSKIKAPLFTGFTEQYYLNNKYFVATKSKALFDYLYFYKRKLITINKKNIEELRINFKQMNTQDWLEFEEYLKIAKSTKLNKIYRTIRKNYVD